MPVITTIAVRACARRCAPSAAAAPLSALLRAKKAPAWAGASSIGCARVGAHDDQSGFNVGAVTEPLLLLLSTALLLYDRICPLLSWLNPVVLDVAIELPMNIDALEPSAVNPPAPLLFAAERCTSRATSAPPPSALNPLPPLRPTTLSKIPPKIAPH